METVIMAMIFINAALMYVYMGVDYFCFLKDQFDFQGPSKYKVNLNDLCMRTGNDRLRSTCSRYKFIRP